MKTAIYVRVSTDEQETINQFPELVKLAGDLKATFSNEDVFSENESAWKAGHQSERKRLLSLIRSGRRKYDYLLIWSLDRLSREGPVMTMGLITELEKYGCQVISVKERSFTDLPRGVRELMIMLMAWIAEQESIRRSERTLAGLERVRKFGSKSGKPIGRPKGKKDRDPRPKSGYYNRWSKKTSGCCQAQESVSTGAV